jgi:N-acetylglucosaminyldiphosphoundecaprenol N-acetyl-beta-D-mannosaminyltransferase
MGIPRVDVLGVGISAINMDMAVAELSRWVSQREQHYVCVTGVHGVMESQADPSLLRIHNRSGLTTPDGMPMVWAGNRAGADHMSRVYGPDLMLEICSRSAAEGWTHYFYGGKERVPELLQRRLQERFPGLEVVGTHSPPFRELTEAEADEIAAAINAANPDFVWVGLSTPKQERWMSANIGRLRAPAILGVGAAFDIHAGLLPQAPGWMQRGGLEWLYRMLKEPRRLWKRYLVNNPRFVWNMLRRPPRLVSVGELDGGSEPPNTTTESELN